MPVTSRYGYRVTMNKAEQKALRNLWHNRPGYLAFRRSAKYSTLNGCWMVPFFGMQVGIESDGYCHS
jgi:hypothetical protein